MSHPHSQLKSRPGDRGAGPIPASAAAHRCRRKFLKYFPRGFGDETYLDWERNYKWTAHQSWKDELAEPIFRSLLKAGRFGAVEF